MKITSLELFKVAPRWPSKNGKGVVLRSKLADIFKRVLSAVLLLGTVGTLAAADPFHTDYMQPEFWKGTTGGKAPVPPEISRIESPVGPAIQAKAISSGTYQGMDLNLPCVVDTAEVGWIEFDFYQTAYQRSGDALVVVYYEVGGKKGSGLFLNFKYTKGQWSHVWIPIDPRTNKGSPSRAPRPPTAKPGGCSSTFTAPWTNPARCWRWPISNSFPARRAADRSMFRATVTKTLRSPETPNAGA